MNTFGRRCFALLMTLALVAIALVPASTNAQGNATLVNIRAAHHADGFDRVVFDFANNMLPVSYSIQYVDRLVGCGSGLAIPVSGNAILQVSFTSAQAHDDNGHGFVPNRLGFAQTWNAYGTVAACDFEGHLTYGIVLARRVAGSSHFTLLNPARVVVDIPTPFQTMVVKDYFINQTNVTTGQPPLAKAVSRRVIPPAVATGALQRLFAYPSKDELANGLMFVNSDASGFTNLRIDSGIARMQLTGGCSSGGSTITIAQEIIPTLQQFSSVKYVKIYDPEGNTEQPDGNVNSIPACLEP